MIVLLAEKMACSPMIAQVQSGILMLTVASAVFALKLACDAPGSVQLHIRQPRQRSSTLISRSKTSNIP